MDLSNSDWIYIKKNLASVPLVVLAKKFKMSELDFCKILRTSGLNVYVKDIELQHMRECEINGVPAKIIKETLGMTDSQFTQICSRHGFQQLRGLESLNLEQVIRSTRWLIEEKLKLEVDDFLPRSIRAKHFTDTNLSDCIRFANVEKKKDPLFKNFSAVAYLICHTYPDTFRPYQFANSKSNDYFRGKDARKNYLYELAWVIENKMGRKLEYIDTYVSNSSFLRTKDLSFYGLGHHWFKHFFNSVDEIKDELVKRYGTNQKNGRTKSEKLVGYLVEAGFQQKCSIENCRHKKTQVHHIIPWSEKESLIKAKIRVDIDSVDNLIFLCSSHHDEIHEHFDWKTLLKENPANWRTILLSSIS